LAALYGRLAMPGSSTHPDRLHIFAGLIATLDGVAAFDLPGKPGGDIGGTNAADRALMGLLRALSDAIVVGTGTRRVALGHI
jgi:hypothetical protein